MAALKGQTDQILLYTAIVAAIVMALTFIAQFVSRTSAQGLFMIMFCGVLLLLLTRPQSKAFFNAAP